MTEACLERKEPTPAEVGNVVAHHDESNEKTEVEIIGALEDRYGERRLAVGRHRQPKKRTQGDGGSRKKLVAAR